MSRRVSPIVVSRLAKATAASVGFAERPIEAALDKLERRFPTWPPDGAQEDGSRTSQNSAFGGSFGTSIVAGFDAAKGADRGRQA